MLAMPHDKKAQVASQNHRIAATAMLGVAVIGYWLLCLPAIEQRGYPPIDHKWTAMPGLWMFPIPIFILLVPGGLFSRRVLFWYAVATGFIDACTELTLVPNPHSVVIWVTNFIFAGPLHLVVTSVMVGVGRPLLRVIGVSAETAISAPSTTRSAIRIFIILIVAICATAFPFVVRWSLLRADANEGSSKADTDWNAQKAVIYRRGNEEIYRRVGNVVFSTCLDPDSGLPLEHDWMQGFEPGYNARIQELLKLRGVPNWTLKKRYVEDADILSLFVSGDMNEVTEFPKNLTPAITIFRRDFSRWGQSIVSGEDGPGLATQHGNEWPTGGPGDRMFVGKLVKYAGVIFVRCERNWVSACTEDGWMLEVVRKNYL